MEGNCKITSQKFLKEGEALFHEGDTGKEVFVIVSGKMRIMKRTGGKSITLAELGPGESVGEMAILLDMPRTASAEAITNCEVISVDRNACLRCIINIPPCASSMLKRLARRIGTMNEQFLKERLMAISDEGK